MGNHRILKVLRNGCEVPYPEEIVYQEMLFLKDYRLNDFPIDGRGNLDEAVDYEEWLQSYLFTCDINLTEEQGRIQDYISANLDFSAALLGGIAGSYENSHALHPRCIFHDDFEVMLDFDNIRDITGDDPYEDYLDGFPDYMEGDKLSKPEYILMDYGYYVLQTQEGIQFRKYWPEFKKIEPIDWLLFGVENQNCEIPDSAWRIYLSLILKRIPQKSVRIEQLKRFYLEYQDALHK